MDDKVNLKSLIITSVGLSHKEAVEVYLDAVDCHCQKVGFAERKILLENNSETFQSLPVSARDADIVLGFLFRAGALRALADSDEIIADLNAKLDAEYEKVASLETQLSNAQAEKQSLEAQLDEVQAEGRILTMRSEEQL